MVCMSATPRCRLGLDDASRGDQARDSFQSELRSGLRELATGSVRAEPLGANESGSKVAFRLQFVMRSAEKLHVFCRGRATSRERYAVMKLEEPALAAAFALDALERALLAVALVYLSNHRAWNVT